MNRKIFKRIFLITGLLFLIVFHTIAQQWGYYTLYATKNGTKAYLIDTADSPVTYKTWTFPTNQKSAYSAYLIAGDTLVRTYKPTGNTTWNSGGIHGGIQKITWDGTVAWDFQYYSSTYCAHHDICPMPNGNVLLISYEIRSAAEATQAGSSSASSFWSEKIIEVKPTGPTTGVIVWEWKLWDHLCQNFNSSKDNYVTSIVNNPQLMNINYGGSLPDRYHMNGLDYNEELDQIVFSVHFMNSAFVIDHSTTTAEAAGHTGGNSGKGGDFLYRWGNPSSYGATGTTVFNTIHDAHWVSSDNPLYPNYLAAYNNQGGTGGKTAINIWNPPYNGNNYSITLGQAFLPTTYAYQYNSSFTATNEGNSQQLPNGNLLINNFQGSIYEVNSAGTTIWTKTAAMSSHAYRYTKCFVRGPKATAGISANNICAGSQINLNSSATSITETNPTYSYNWSSVPAGFYSNSQNPTDAPTVNTTYLVTITNTAIGCSDTTHVVVNVLDLPATPTITQNLNTLTSSTALTYQWYLNSVLLSGETNQNLEASTDGTYEVVVSDANGCTNTSLPFTFTFTGINEETENGSIIIYPNPSTGIININGSLIEMNDYEILVFDLCGKILYQDKNVNIVDLSELKQGLYYVTIISGEKKVNRKLTILK